MNLPPNLQQQLEPRIPQLRGRLHQHLAGPLTKLRHLLGPLWAEFGPLLHQWGQNALKQLKNPTPALGSDAGLLAGPTVGGQFRHLLIVGLNRAELLLQGETTPVWNDSWQELVDDTLRRSLGLIFFAPRGLDGEPVPPIPFLMGEELGDDLPLSQPVPSLLQGVGLLDFCRLQPAPPNQVNMLVAADCLFHWDGKDTYVLPTTPTSWVRDVEGVLKGYPRTTRAHIYTQWDVALLPESDRFTTHAVRQLPLQSSAWLNEPTLQEKYANHAVAAGVMAAVLVIAGLWWQGREVTALTEQLNIIEQQIPGGTQAGGLDRAVAEQERQFARRPLFALALKDTHRAIAESGLEVQEIELRVPENADIPESYILTLTMPIDTYSGWLQQEPAARSFLLNTAMVHAVRKPPGTGFKLEGLIMLAPWEREFKRLLPELPSTIAPTLLASPTTTQAATTRASTDRLSAEDGE